MGDFMTAFWGMTINNYDERDLAMVHSGYPDHMRELVHTLEEGEEGTPHIQAYLKLKRQQRLSFVKKLFPRGHFKALTSATYIENTKSYAQKLDATARGPAVHKFYDPVHTIEGVVKKVIIKGIIDWPDVIDLDEARTRVERDMVVEDYTMAKIFVSTTYKNMWKQFGHQMHGCVFQEYQRKVEIEEQENSRVKFTDTHTTHTHAENLFSSVVPKPDGEASSRGDERSEEQEEGTEDEGEGEDQADEADGDSSEGHCEADADEVSGDEICI